MRCASLRGAAPSGRLESTSARQSESWLRTPGTGHPLLSGSPHWRCTRRRSARGDRSPTAPAQSTPSRAGFAGKQSHAAAHREVGEESQWKNVFHERYFGEDHMGGPGIVRLVQVPMRDLFGMDSGARADRRFAVLPGGGPRRDELAAMGRGSGPEHAFVLGSPLGKTLARPADEEARAPAVLGRGVGALRSAAREGNQSLGRQHSRPCGRPSARATPSATRPIARSRRCSPAGR